jgi:hypothetical protein
MRTRAALIVATTVALAACQPAAPPDRHVLWSGSGVPLRETAVVSTHDSKAACLAARDAYVRATLQPGDVSGAPDRTGTTWVTSSAGALRGYVCHPFGLTPS